MTTAVLYRLGGSESEAYLSRPHPSDTTAVPAATGSSPEDGAPIIFDLESPDVDTWWRVFLEHGPLLGQTTFHLSPQQIEETVYVVLAPGTPSRDRVIVYEGIAASRPSLDGPRTPGGSTPRDVTLFPIAVENLTAIDGLEVRLAVEQADSTGVYLDPGCRLFSSGATDDFRADVHKADTLETGAAIFKLLIYPRVQQAGGAEIGAGSDILFYVTAFGQVPATGLCVDPDSAFFSLQQGEVSIAVEVSNPAECVFPRPCELTLTHPNGGERFMRGDEVTITWNSSEWCSGDVRIELQREEQTVAEIASSTDNDGVHTWVTEQSAYQVDGYRIRVTDIESGLNDESNETFSIGPVVVTPTGTGTYVTIQAALDAAANGDQIELTDGTFAGAGNRDIDFQGKEIDLVSASDDPQACIIDCGGSESEAHRGFHFHSGEGSGARVRGVTIYGGYRFGSATNGAGGAILCTNTCSPRIENCILAENWAYSGGGAYVGSTTSPTFVDCAFANNSARDYGAALYLGGAIVTLSSCTLYGNVAGLRGGGVHSSNSSAELAACTLRDNRAERGGGVSASLGSSVTLDGCLFQQNQASEEGGGAACQEATTNFSDCRFVENYASRNGGAFIGWGANGAFVECEFHTNSSGHSGAALFLNNSDPRVEHCVFIANSASGASPTDGGGAIRCDVSSPQLSNCTLYGNYASRGSGLDLNDNSHPTLANTIASFGLEGEALFSGQTCRPLLFCCDLYGNQGGDWVGYIEQQYGTDGNISEDPWFCASSEDDLRLQSDSPCAPFSPPNPECDLIGGLSVGCAQ